MFLKRVVITGLGTINPLGKDVESFFANLDKGVSGATMIDRFDTTLFKSKFACQVQDFDPEAYGIGRKEANKNDRYAQFAIVTAEQAVKDSGIDLETADRSRMGVVIGSGVGGIETLTREIMDYSPEVPPRFSPFLIPKIITNIASGVVAIRLDLHGPNFAVTSACASGSHSIMEAASLIQLGRADVMLAGGSEAPISIPGVGGFNSMHALSSNNEEYLTASRPFDLTRDGFVMGEGAGVLVLEEYEHALARGAHIYAELVGCGYSADAYHMTAPDPEGTSAAMAMTQAIKDAGIAPSDIDYINLHGTSTKLGDAAELKAIKKVFGEDAYNVSMSSTKSMTGHLLGAAGAIESIICIHALRDGIIPPTINFKTPDPAIDYGLKLTLNAPEHREVRYALCNNFGFGGQNACLILKKY